MKIPTKINIGSGKDFRDDYLNIDIDDYWSPDIVLDISKPLPAKTKSKFKTDRFGDVTIAKDKFEEIVANDVLEHIPDLVSAMTNCLQLLRTGGLFNIVVPYDLSWGAWQDPTHLRAFNERSWLYYTDWFWYLGWKTHRFVAKRVNCAYSPIGREMSIAGQPSDLILRTPRAVESMQVTLEKIALTDKDKQMLETFKPSGKRARV